MTEYSKEIFSDPKLLREKLGIYLQSPEKVEIYARICEIAFAKGGKTFLSTVASWSWYAFFFAPAFFMYRKCYLMAIICMILYCIPGVCLLVCFIAPIFAKFIVVKRFEKILDYQNDNLLMSYGGQNTVMAWIIGILFGSVPIIVTCGIISAYMIPKIAENGIHKEAQIAKIRADVATIRSDIILQNIISGSIAFPELEGANEATIFENVIQQGIYPNSNSGWSLVEKDKLYKVCVSNECAIFNYNKDNGHFGCDDCSVDSLCYAIMDKDCQSSPKETNIKTETNKAENIQQDEKFQDTNLIEKQMQPNKEIWENNTIEFEFGDDIVLKFNQIINDVKKYFDTNQKVADSFEQMTSFEFLRYGQTMNGYALGSIGIENQECFDIVAIDDESLIIVINLGNDYETNTCKQVYNNKKINDFMSKGNFFESLNGPAWQFEF